MQHLGHTRSSFQRDHILQTPDTFIRAPLPGMRNATAIVHAGPAIGARFAQYTVEFAKDGEFTTGHAQTFLFVLEGVVAIASDLSLSAGQFAYVPGGTSAPIRCKHGGRAAVVEKQYLVLSGAAPRAFHGSESAIAPKPLLGDEALEVRTLVPDDPCFDFAVNTMTFQPGASLPLVEMHIMEHGLLMLEGEGIYRLNQSWYPVCAGDFIYMAPYCPQWFGALGKKAARYLIYKDWSRHPLHPHEA